MNKFLKTVLAFAMMAILLFCTVGCNESNYDESMKRNDSITESLNDDTLGDSIFEKIKGVWVRRDSIGTDKTHISYYYFFFNESEFRIGTYGYDYNGSLSDVCYLSGTIIGIEEKGKDACNVTVLFNGGETLEHLERGGAFEEVLTLEFDGEDEIETYDNPLTPDDFLETFNYMGNNCNEARRNLKKTPYYKYMDSTVEDILIEYGYNYHNGPWDSHVSISYENVPYVFYWTDTFGSVWDMAPYIEGHPNPKSKIRGYAVTTKGAEVYYGIRIGDSASEIPMYEENGYLRGITRHLGATIYWTFSMDTQEILYASVMYE